LSLLLGGWRFRRRLSDSSAVPTKAEAASMVSGRYRSVLSHHS
jgi:hypothetical protein